MSSANAPAEADNAFRAQVVAWLRVAAPFVVVIAAIVAGTIQGVAASILILAAGALAGVIAVFWASVRTFFGETPLSGADAYALGAPRVEEEQKRAVLRALKDLEFERSVGKISEDDFRALTAKYRAEAKRLLRSLDEEAEPRRVLAEALVAARLRRAGMVAEETNATEEKTTASAEEGQEEDLPAERLTVPTPLSACAGCGTANDADAVFCKKCGTRVASASAAEG